MKHFLRLFVFAVLCLFVAATAYAQGYPTKPVRMVLPFAPGGASDVVGRSMAPRLSQELGQQVIVDNRAGASGNIGVEVVARATPDGYTVLLGNSGAMAINPGLFPAFPIRPVRDFIAVTQVVDVPGALVVHPSVPVTTLKEFIEYAKARPGKLNYGSSGAGAPFRLAMEYFMREAGLKIVHVPYKGGAGAATIGVLGGEVNAVFTSLSSVITHVKSGKLKLLSVVAPHRLAVLPNTPTMVESGFPEMTAGAWQGVYVPAGTPRPVVNKLFDAVTKTMSDPEIVKRLQDTGSEIIVSKSPEEFTKFMKSETDLYAKVIKEIGLAVGQ